MSQQLSSPLVDGLLDAPVPPSEIGWLDRARAENRKAFAANGLPDTRVEAWKYTSLRALGQRRFVVGDAEAASRVIDPSLFELPGVAGPRLVIVNGVFRADLSRLEDLPDGMVLQPVSRALQSQPERLRRALSRQYRDRADAFAQLNSVSAADGVMLRVAAGARISAPVQLVFMGATAALDLSWHVRNLIEVGDGAELNLIEQHVADGGQAQLVTVVGDIELGAGARLRHVVLQNTSTGASLIRRSRLRLRERSHAIMHVLELGGGLARHDLQARLLGDEARLDTRGVFMPHGRQHIDTQLTIHHLALHTRSSSIWRGVASERGRGVFRGAIKVARGADGSDASLGNKNLLLSPGAEIDTKPELEIHADEVKAAHGATIGQLDEGALFYLRSRGIPLAEARAMLTAAFCRAVLDDLPSEALREHLSTLLLIHLPHA